MYYSIYITMPTSDDLGPTGTGDVGRELGCCSRGSCSWRIQETSFTRSCTL